jgi:hypothetical protein
MSPTVEWEPFEPRGIINFKEMEIRIPKTGGFYSYLGTDAPAPEPTKMYVFDSDRPFLRDIAKNPKDDLPRLRYADYLEQTDWLVPPDSAGKWAVIGNPAGTRQGLADSIRHGVANPECVFRCEADPDVGQFCATRNMGRDPPAYCPTCFLMSATLPPKFLGEGHYVGRRGFVEKLETSVPDWRAHGPSVVELCPVTDVRLFGLSLGRTTELSPLRSAMRPWECTNFPRDWLLFTPMHEDDQRQGVTEMGIVYAPNLRKLKRLCSRLAVEWTHRAKGKVVKKVEVHRTGIIHAEQR